MFCRKVRAACGTDVLPTGGYGTKVTEQTGHGTLSPGQSRQLRAFSVGHLQKLMTLSGSALAHHRSHLILTILNRKHVAKHCRSLHIVITDELHQADLQFLFCYFHSLSCYFNFRNTAWSAALRHICVQRIILTYQHRMQHFYQNLSLHCCPTL